MDERPHVGEEFAGYRIERLLGRGGMGIVYLAQHVRLRRRAALKVLAPEMAQQEGFQERFVRESRLAASLDHPNIVPVYDAGEQDGILYIAMRFVEGTDLATVLDGEPDGLEPGRALSILEQIADALDTAHAEGLVHRDVKPGNVLIGAPTRAHGRAWAYLTDFGLTKQRTGETRLTKTGVFMGTLQYVAPEQIRGEELDGRADQYALACVLFETLTGRPPFTKDVELALLSAHLSELPPAVSSVRPGLSRAIDEVVARGMAKTPPGRFATCTQLMEAASAAVQTGARPAATLPTAKASPPATPTEAARSPQTVPAVATQAASAGLLRRGKRLWIAAAAAVLGVVAGAMALLASAGDESATPPVAAPAASETGATGATGQITAANGPTAAAPGVFRIAFTVDRNGTGDIFAMNSDGSGLTALVEGLDDDGEPALSPEGDRIAFVRRAPDSAALYVMDVTGTNLARLTPDGVGAETPAWSPDGTKIAFSGSSGIFVIDADGSGLAQITTGQIDLQPTWSPDGSQIALSTFVEEGGSGDFQIAVVNADGTGLKILTQSEPSPHPLDSRDPAWSPDGTKIAFVKTVLPKRGDYLFEIFVINPDGTGFKRVTKSNPPPYAANSEPTWSPDGTKIVFVTQGEYPSSNCRLCGRDLYSMNPDGTEAVVLYDAAADVFAPSTASL